MLLHRNFRGLQLVPSQVVPVARAAFVSQGIDGSAVSDTGEVDPQALLALAWDKVLIQTSVTPDMVIDLKAPPDPETAKMMNEFQPRITLMGRVGNAVIAPYGIAEKHERFPTWLKISLGLGLGVAGIAVLGKALL